MYNVSFHRTSGNRSLIVAFIIFICFFTFFIHNEVIYADIMESRNLVTAREIVSDGNWLIPRMNGELRLEKPPLPTWIAACIEWVAPGQLMLQRAVAGLIATMMVFFLYALATLMTKNNLFGIISAIALCTSFNVILMGRTATWDIYCHGFMLGAIYFIFKGGQKPGTCWKEFIWAGILLGLSFLGKGPVSFYALLLPFLLAYLLIYRPSFRDKWRAVAVMLIICLVMSLWWPVLLYLTHKELVLSVWNKESTAWLERNVRPWYYYWKFFAESGIWSLFLVTALIWPYWRKRLQFRKEYLFAVCWVFMILICLSLLPEKKTRYLLPVLIPSALVIAHLLLHWWQCFQKGVFSRRERLIWRINALLIASVVALLPVGIYIMFFLPGKLSLGYFLFFVFLLEFLALGLFYAAVKNKIPGFLLGILALFFSIEIFFMPVLVKLFNNPQLNSIHAVNSMKALEHVPFYYPCHEELRIEIVYEARRKIRPYCFQENDSLPALPFVLVSQGKAEDVLPDVFRDRVELQVIGVYDDNKRPAGTTWHSPLFVHQVTLVSEKGDLEQ